MTGKPTNFIFNLGDRVRDVINGYEGIIIGRFEYWTGCNHYGVEGLSKEGKAPYENCDEQRLELVKADAAALARVYEQQTRRASPGQPVPRNPAPPA